jgi:hypothetical protein
LRGRFFLAECRRLRTDRVADSGLRLPSLWQLKIAFSEFLLNNPKVLFQLSGIRSR